jgi:hypothetical protein
MASHKKYDAVATIGEYTDRSGEKKKRYQNIGSVFENEDGRLSLKLDAIPVGPEWSGWISFFEPKARDGQEPRQQPTRHERAKVNAYQPEPESEDEQEDIPF